MYNFPLSHIKTLKLHCFDAGLSMPHLFRFASAEQLQACYNGIGPDRWSSRFRRFTTWILTFLEAPALIHDWEFTYQPKTYGAFTLANLRLAYNAAKDKHPFSGITAAVLCQLFGWRGFLNADSLPPSKPHLSGTVSPDSFLRFLPKSASSVLASVLFPLLLAGCFSSSEDRIRKFDPSGNLMYEKICSESPVKSILNSMDDKSIILWDNSWIAFISASSFSLEDPAPVLKMGIGHADKGYISLLGQHDFSPIPETVRAVREDTISLSASGIESSHSASPAPDSNAKSGE